MPQVPAPIRVLRPNAMLQRPTFPARPVRRGHGRRPVARLPLPVAPGVAERAPGLRPAALPAPTGQPPERGATRNGTATAGGHRSGSSPVRLVLRGYHLPKKPRPAERHAGGDVFSAGLFGPQVSLLAERSDGKGSDISETLLRQRLFSPGRSAASAAGDAHVPQCGGISATLRFAEQDAD